ncbi:alkyl sulfatase dimerization domain-containing protein [Halopseudomonas phragmitis]|uniref:Metallo-beta-lactamase domain-containing protein n=1 Tax=Halopseudomonas phragmitis TaxID=1931241 RepID=A0A1V0B8R8_9GAMM|nr:alkyl sulfatase dimerization domain-containing protein [Halopseudomonas phragmitis]AQZ96336.1 hypothetical protein BVH74_16940 [Halopseudomonas phragmitis]
MLKHNTCHLAAVLVLVTGLASADTYTPEALSSGRADPSLHLQQGSTQTEAQRINEVSYMATGFGNSFMVVTGAGNVVIDTSLRSMARHHRQLLGAVDDGPIHSIILTHGHGDHTGGVDLWKQPDTRVIGQRNMVEFLHYQQRLEGIFNQRNRAQFGFALDAGQSQAATVQNFAAPMLPDTLFDDHMAFTLGDVEFELIHTPSETDDALTVWLPQYKTAFVGDLYYAAFPNIYTLRGTKPRWALDYVASIDRVLALEPEILLPGHGAPIRGKEAIRSALTHYRDAIQYVHDQTVIGMNQGKDVYTLMREIKLPESLQMSEAYGRIAWSVRGIYEGYMGWFDGNPVNMYDLPPEGIYPDLVALAGGSQAVIGQARVALEQNDEVKALRLLDAALSAAPDDREALNLKLQILVQLRRQSSNLNESGWLNYGINSTRQQLGD